MTGGQGRLRIGIDTGGTFTDIVAYDEDTGELAVTKTPTTPGDPSIGFADGLAKVLGQVGADDRAVAAVCHGTTIATNQLLEGQVGGLGLAGGAHQRGDRDRVGRVAAPQPDRVDGQVPGDREEPGRGRCPPGVVGRGVAPGPREGFLGNVLGAGGVAEDRERQPVHLALVAANRPQVSRGSATGTASRPG